MPLFKHWRIQIILLKLQVKRISNDRVDGIRRLISGSLTAVARDKWWLLIPDFSQICHYTSLFLVYWLVRPMMVLKHQFLRLSYFSKSDSYTGAERGCKKNIEFEMLKREKASDNPGFVFLIFIHHLVALVITQIKYGKILSGSITIDLTTW